MAGKQGMKRGKPLGGKSFIEKTAEALRLIPAIEPGPQEMTTTPLEKFPPKDQWKNWEENDAAAWPRRAKNRYHLIPTTCFNCESACGLVAYIDKENGQVKRFEGNPFHPASRGRNCAKGPATINQITDPERILYPLKRKGPRGGGGWERISWDQALNEIAQRVRKALHENRRDEVVYHVGRPGHEGYMERVLKAWGVDGHNSHTNICSAGARLGFALWQGYDRPSPDFANAKFILLISSHLETGHFFNPHAQRIVEGMMDGAGLAVMDPRLSNTASMADEWMPTYPGSEPAVLLAMARIILQEGTFNREFLETWVNWPEYMAARHPGKPAAFTDFVAALIEEYKDFTPEFAAKEAGISAEQIVKVARQIAQAGSRFAAHNWRGPGAGALGGWQVARTLHFLHVLTGSVGTFGGTSPSAWSKYKPHLPHGNPPAPKNWNELQWPWEYPLTHYEMSEILPHLLKDGRGKLDTYFTRVFNPVWTYPDGFSWIEVLRDENMVGCHVHLSPTWNETAYFADYVLPMGHASERHDINSYETHSGTWVAFRQPVLRRYMEENGQPVEFTWQANPGEVWEEDEFWMELSWRMDPDGALGIKPFFESPYRKGERMTVDDYYQYTFERVPGLTAAAKAQGLTELGYMKEYGAFEVVKEAYLKHLDPLDDKTLAGIQTNPKTGLITKDGAPVGLMVNGKAVTGFPTPSRRQEIYSATMAEWGWPEHTLPGYIKSHVHPDNLDASKNEYALVPNFRLPVLIHSRSGNAKWLVEIAHKNPIWMHTSDAEKMGLVTGSLLKVVTDIGWFIDKVWVSESVKPGVVACSHHIGRWKLENGPQANSWAANTVRIQESAPGQWKLSHVAGVQPFKSSDPDSSRIFWRDGGVHQNITHAVHPDPWSGMHCWHQRVRLEKPAPGENYGDIFVDTNRSFANFKEWLAKTRPPANPEGLRRPLWFNRPLRPVPEAYYRKKK
ncbi:MAG: molybdopterin-dependent oxidoreductase [Deltaproteobacteria bacterium]|nr:molybdopterin-dependent oxidoreductase [Deltaproteobacteria bacterium]MDH4122013.1 molybdopterin-dependent oxidoreductase [Deltaproteobacteria bacterium]